MPIYEYKCEKGHVFDVIQKFSDEPLTECAECGAPASRVLHSPAVHFKGSGFHNTDYARKSGSAAPDGNGSSGEGDSKSSDSGKGSDSKDSGSKSSDSKPKAPAAD